MIRRLLPVLLVLLTALPAFALDLNINGRQFESFVAGSSFTTTAVRATLVTSAGAAVHSNLNDRWYNAFVSCNAGVNTCLQISLLDTVVTTIQDEGIALTQRAIVNFAGTGVTCADDAGNAVTKCTITSGGGSGTVTHTLGNLTANQLVIGNAVDDETVLGSLGTATTLLHGNAGGAPVFGAVVSADLNLTTTTCTNQFIRSLSATAVGTCATVAAADITANAVASAQTAVVNVRRVCTMVVGADNATAVLADADLGPQGRQCFVPAASTCVEVTVAADAGTPNVIPRRNVAGVTGNLVSSALATAAAGGIACSKAGATTCIDGATTASATLQNTALAAGSWIELASGTAGGTAKRMTVSVTYTID